MFPFVLLFYFFLLCCYSIAPLVHSLNAEGSVLLTLKQSLTDPQGSMSNWNSSDENPCSWNGITCKDQNVVSISIPKRKLSGSLPSSLGSLSQLRHVNFRNNKLFGDLPTQLFQAQGLQSLVLYGNLFSGPVSSEIQNLRYLQTLDLSQNFFNGSLPAAIVQCKRLKSLVLSQNNFSGPLPDGFGTELSSLERLNLSFNHFNGSIPSDLGNLSSLQGTVDLSHNHFSGSIPASLGNLPEKVYIDLTFNNLNGPIPQNGALMNRGPTAFIGNPGLCGPPLKNSCGPDTPSASSPPSFPFIPNNSSAEGSMGSEKNKGLSTGAVVSIVVGDIIGICLLGLLFSFCYSRVCGFNQDLDEDGINKGSKGRKECFCFRKDESEALSDNNVEQYDLVPLDSHVTFDLDELLKASAFVLGKSGIGIMYKVVLEDGLALAVRRLGEGVSQRFKEFQTEVEAIGKLRHPNIATLRAYYWSVDEKLLIYDYISNGSLDTAIHGKAGLLTFAPLSWSYRLKIMKGTARGLVYLHEFSPKKYVHGDLKPSNILLGHDMEPHISDFGVGRLANIAGGSPTLQSNRVVAEKQHGRQKSISTEVTTGVMGNGYMAPEALKVVKPSQKWDVYSYGVMLLEMITGKPSIVQLGNSEMDLVQWIQFCIEEKKPLVEVLDPYLADDADKEECEKVKLLARIEELDEKLRRKTREVEEERALLERVEALTRELQDEKAKRNRVTEAYKRLKSQHVYLRRKVGLCEENVAEQKKFESGSEFGTRQSPVAEPVLASENPNIMGACEAAEMRNEIPLEDFGGLESKTPEVFVTGCEINEVKEKPSEEDRGTNLSSPSCGFRDVPKCPPTTKLVSVSSTKRPASSWRQTRTHQSRTGPDPHDDFLDTPLENIRGNLNKDFNKEDLPNPIQEDINNDSSDDETQDMAAKSSPQKKLKQYSINVVDQRSYKYVEPVRKKAERENLKGVECKQCRKFYDAVLPNADGKDADSKQNFRCEHLDGVSRHRYRYVPPLTPEGFWNIGFESEM